jgi:hypothetical protein
MTGLDSNQVNLVTDTQKLAFKAGVEDRRVQNLAKQEKAKTATVYSTGFTENKYSAKLTSDEREMFSSISRDLKMDIEFADKLIAYYVNGKGREANARHSDGKMSVSSTSNLPMVSVAIHESFHRMRELDPQGTDALMNFLYESAEQNARRLELGVKGASWFDKIKEDYANVEGMDTIDYIEEVAAGRSEIIFSSAKEYNAWRASLEVNPQAKSGWQKLLETIKEVLEDLWAAITNSKMSLEAKRQAQKEIEIFSDAYRAAMKVADVRVAEQSAKTNSAKSLEIKTNKEYNENENYSLKWHTDLTYSQLAEVENWIRKKGNIEATRITNKANWYEGKINGDDLFVIYSTEDINNPTVLYEVKGGKASLERDILKNLLEERKNGESVNGKSAYVNWVSDGGWMQNVNSSQNNLTNLGRGANNQNVGVLQRQSKRNGSRAFWNVLENLFRQQEQGGKVNYSLKSSFSTDGMTDSEVENAQKIISSLKTRAIGSKYVDGYASYTIDRIEREIRGSSSSDVIDYAKSYVAWVSPIDFVYATTTSEQTRQALKEEAGTLNIEKLKGETQPIHLTVDFETGEIVGHEGRHRMLALQQEGIDNVAIIIDALNDNRYHTKPIEFMSLTGQQFQEHRKGLDMFLHNMLPLSQRYADVAREVFTNPPKNGIQYSLKDSDGNTLTKAQQEYFKDSKVRDEKGNLLVVYHGSSSKFTVFDHKHINTHGNAHGRGFYFTENKSLAEGYNKDGGQLLKGYLNIENPLSEEKITIKKPALAKLIKATCEEQAKSLVEDDGYENMREALPDTWVSNYVDTYGMSIADAYKEVANIIYSGSDNDVDIIAELTNAGAGYDTTLKLTHDILGYDGVIYENEDGYHEFVSLISNQFKSIDNANPSANADINFSLKENNSISSKDRKELLDIIEHLKSEFELTKFAKADPKKLAKMTRDLLKEYSSQADFDETYKAIDELYTYMANGKDGHNPVWEEVYDGAYRIAQGIAENALVVDNYAYQEYKHLRDYLRTTPMKFNPDYDSVPYSYENFNEFRKLNMGRLKFTKDGMGIDSVYQELSHLYPEFFDSAEQTNSADQLERIVDVLDELRQTERNPFDREIEQVSMYLANDLTSRFFDIPQARPTFADKAERRVIEANIKGRKKLDALREQKDAKIKKLLETQKEKTKKQLDKLREQRDAKIKKEQEKRRNAISKMSENQKAKVLRARIMRHTSDLSKKLVNPTDNQHIPHELQGAVAKLLECINLESNYTYDTESHSYKKNDEGLPSKRTQAFNELRAVYANIASSVVVDPDLMGEYGLLSGVISLADKRLADMTPSELDTVWQAIRAIEASVNTANKLFSDGKFATIFEVADTLRSQNEGKKSKVEYKGMIGKGKDLATLNMLTPETYLHYLGDAGDSIFRMMRDAQDKHISIMKEVSDFTHKALKDVDVNSLEKTLHTVKLGGEDIRLSTAQLMELYVLMNREQAQEHILVGGILPDTIESKGIKQITQSKPTRNISIEEVSAAIANLTDEQKKIADKLQTYASTVLSTYGNEASMQVYNYEKFHEEHYWPIRTNRQEIQTDVDKDTSVTTVANKGMTKATKPHANTSVRIGSIFDTFSSHSSDMATYAAWLGTSEDVNRIRNFVFWENGARTGTVKGIIDTVHGRQGSQYFEKLLTDVAIGVKGTDNMNPLDKFVGNYKSASVGANLRVIIQQPTAILRALDMIDARYLTEGAVRPLKGWGKAKKYAPIAQWKDWGYFDINTGRQMKDILFDNASLLEKTKQVGMWGASMADSFAWGHLWNAVEAEIKSTRKELEVGTDAYYKAVATRFTEIVDHTQVVDGILQRSQIMRSADSLTKMATSFMGEPTKQYNMAMSAFYDFKTGRGDARKSAAVKLGRTALALATAGIINACAQSIIDAMRDDDKEKKYWERWLRAFAGDGDEAKWYDTNLADTANPLNYIPFAKDIVSIVRGYDVKRMDTEAITKVFDASKNMYKSVTGEGKYTIAEASAQLFAEISRLYGVPVANVKRDVKSLVTSVAIETDSYVMQYRIEKAMLNINYAGNSKNFTDILFNAYINDREAYEVIYNDMVKNGFDADKIKNGMESRMKKAEGIENVTELSKRYMSPDVEKVYDAGIKRAESNEVWNLASDEQIQEAKNNLYSFLASPSDEQKAKREEARAYDVDETDIILWELASKMADDAGKDNDYVDAKEKKAALEMLDLGNSEIAYFYDTKTSAKAYDNDIDMYRFAMFMGAISGIEGKGKTDKIKALAEEYAADYREKVFFVGSGLSSYKKKPDYINLFGEE